MTRPTRILIGGQPFSVEWQDQPGTRLHADSTDYWDLGTTIIAEQKIVIRTLQADYQVRDTVLHEILHAILNLTAQKDRFKDSLDDKKTPEEPIVSAVATAMLTVLRANPELVAWLIEELA